MCSVAPLLAQVEPGGAPAATGNEGAAAGAPIPGNIAYLLAMGAVYGFYKVKRHFNKHEA